MQNSENHDRVKNAHSSGDHQDKKPGAEDSSSVQSGDQPGLQVDSDQNQVQKKDPQSEGRSKEIGGPKGPEPTRYGDWERKGRCIDF